jgi:citrate lyase subunit beta/citryl-CoA lyase
MGFRAKVALHPKQVPVMRDAIRPSAEKIAWARKVIEADAKAAGGVTTVDGTMVDGPVVMQATQILLLAGEDVPTRPGA